MRFHIWLVTQHVQKAYAVRRAAGPGYSYDHAGGHVDPSRLCGPNVMTRANYGRAPVDSPVAAVVPSG
ncbi:hypothetical protein GCM10023114_51730 [Mycolicibacterium sediminis]|uniref:Uncharacterized protein n=1 Tax=Mycolicibacterium sediminis TaxID=1286180 RepID=A0A7I7QLC2_9MYCO|nr:hypothetical protein MSEDJ_11700 [Mycolicibacterium sediminis]